MNDILCRMQVCRIYFGANLQYCISDEFFVSDKTFPNRVVQCNLQAKKQRTEVQVLTEVGVLSECLSCLVQGIVSNDASVTSAKFEHNLSKNYNGKRWPGKKFETTAKGVDENLIITKESNAKKASVSVISNDKYFALCYMQPFKT